MSGVHQCFVVYHSLYLSLPPELPGIQLFSDFLSIVFGPFCGRGLFGAGFFQALPLLSFRYLSNDTSPVVLMRSCRSYRSYEPNFSNRFLSEHLRSKRKVFLKFHCNPLRGLWDFVMNEWDGKTYQSMVY